MIEHIFKLLAAYAVGTAVMAVFVRLVWLMPLDDIVKHILSWILPLPAILIVLVLSYYGPSSPVEGEVLPRSGPEFIRVFFLGALSAFGIYAVIPIARFTLRRLTGKQGDGNETKE